jgi:hypothetical protein
MCDVVLDFDAPRPPSRLDIEARNSELTGVYVGQISRTVHSNVEKVAFCGGFQSVVASG